MITVFYDGKCGVCLKEINHYKRIAPSGIFHWQDVTINATSLEKHNVQLVDALMFLHVKDTAGRLHIGVDAFIVIWRQLRGWHILAFFVRLPLIRQIAGGIYRLFAKYRFERLAHCKIARKAR